MALTPNMNLPSPEPGVTPGPDYATDQQNAFTLIDEHDHTSGHGVPITPAAININASLSMANQLLTSAKGVTLQSQSVAPFSSNGLYNSGGNLHYIDNAGNDIPLTAGGSIAGSAGNITNLSAPAIVNYDSVGKSFTFQSNSGTAYPAYLDFGYAIFRNMSAGSYGLSLYPPNAMGANYSLYLPSSVGSTKIMTLDSSGAMAGSYTVDNSTLEISSNVIRVKDAGIVAAKLASDSVTTAKIANLNVTQAKMYARSVSTTASSGNILQTYGGPVNTTNVGWVVTGIDGTIVSTGKPLMISLSISDIYSSAVSGPAAPAVRVEAIDSLGGSHIYMTTSLFRTVDGVSSSQLIPALSITQAVDAITTGTVTFYIEFTAGGSSPAGSINFGKAFLTVYEIN